MKLILASTSPRRKEILTSFGFRYKVIPPPVDENIREKNPRRLVEKLALEKSLSVLPEVSSSRCCDDTFILGADTIVVLGEKIIGKPSSLKDGIRILKDLSATRHRVYTGLALIDVKNLRYIVSSDVSIVQMRRLDGKEIISAARRHRDKAGAYAVQEENDAFVEKIEGDYFNVVGLPVKLFVAMIKKLRPNISLPQKVKNLSFRRNREVIPAARLYIKPLS